MGTDANALLKSDREVGVIPRFVKELFARYEVHLSFPQPFDKLNHWSQSEPPSQQTIITATFLELYNEQILDLLDSSGAITDRSNKDGG